MNRARWQIWALLAPLALGGCKGLFGATGLPRDPMFVSQKPIEGKIVSTAPVTVAGVEPTPPSVPDEIANRPAYARRKSSTLPDRVILSGRPARDVNFDLPSPARMVPGVLTNRPIQRDNTAPEPR